MFAWAADVSLPSISGHFSPLLIFLTHSACFLLPARPSRTRLRYPHLERFPLPRHISFRQNRSIGASFARCTFLSFPLRFAWRDALLFVLLVAADGSYVNVPLLIRTQHVDAWRHVTEQAWRCALRYWSSAVACSFRLVSPDHKRKKWSDRRAKILPWPHKFIRGILLATYRESQTRSGLGLATLERVTTFPLRGFCRIVWLHKNQANESRKGRKRFLWACHK